MKYNSEPTGLNRIYGAHLKGMFLFMDDPRGKYATPIIRSDIDRRR